MGAAAKNHRLILSPSRGVGMGAAATGAAGRGDAAALTGADGFGEAARLRTILKRGNKLKDAMTRVVYQLLNSRGFGAVFCRRRLLREILLPLTVGISIGYILGGLSFEEVDLTDHILQKEHDFSHSSMFFLRCVIIIHPNTKKPLNFISAIRDTYGSECNQTIFYTQHAEVQKKVTDQYIILVNSDSNAFYWKYYQHVMEHSAELPAQWTFIADEQSFLIVNNLRSLLENSNFKESVIFGRLLKPRTIFSYLFPFFSYERVSVQAGVVFSYKAIESLSRCRGHFFPRSTEAALFLCSKEHDVRIISPVDEDGMHLFHGNDLKTLIPSAYRNKNGVKIKEAQLTACCCSDHSVTFGQMTYKDIRLAHFASSTWRVFGQAGTTEINSSFAIDPDLLVYKHKSENSTDIYSTKILQKQVEKSEFQTNSSMAKKKNLAKKKINQT